MPLIRIRLQPIDKPINAGHIWKTNASQPPASWWQLYAISLVCKQASRVSPHLCTGGLKEKASSLSCCPGEFPYQLLMHAYWDSARAILKLRPFRETSRITPTKWAKRFAENKSRLKRFLMWKRNPNMPHGTCNRSQSDDEVQVFRTGRWLMYLHSGWLLKLTVLFNTYPKG